MNFNSVVGALVMSSLVFATVSINTPAHAAELDTVPVQIQWGGTTTTNNTLFIEFSNGTWATAYQTVPTGCAASNNRGLDTLKAWQSLATAALLSGKQIHVTTTSCSGNTIIQYLSLKKGTSST